MSNQNLRPSRSGLLLALGAAALLSSVVARAGAHGKPLELESTTAIQDILAHPEEYEGKLVQVKGPVKEVCQEMGCWLKIDAGNGVTLLARSTGDKVVVPPGSTGKSATVEGIVVVSHPEKSAEGGECDAKADIRLETAGVVID